MVRNDDRRFAGIYGNRRFDYDTAANGYYGEDGVWYEGQDSTSAASGQLENNWATGQQDSSEQYYGTNFEEHGPGVGHYSSSVESGLPVSQIEGYSTTGWEYAARGFEDGLTRLFDRAINR